MDLIDAVRAVEFQSTHPRGVRLTPLPVQTGRACFNPRTHAGCDFHTSWAPRAVRNWFQSTHPRGVRPHENDRSGIDIAVFQSTHPRGVRLACRSVLPCSGVFQSTHPRGVRPCAPCERIMVFQSTHPRGVRLSGSGWRPGGAEVSIHAPTRGATSDREKNGAAADVSIHAPTRGATLSYFPLASSPLVSIHAPTRGATRVVNWALSAKTVSIHAPTRGATVYYVKSI